VELKVRWNIVRDQSGLHLESTPTVFKGFDPAKYLKGNLDSIPSDVRQDVLKELRTLYTEHRIIQDDSAAEMKAPLTDYLANRVQDYKDRLKEYGISLELPKSAK